MRPLNKISGNPFGSDKPDPSSYDPAKGEPVYHRGVFIAHRCNDLTLANLTIRNTTPHGGSQAETIILNGTTSARAILANVDLYSFQDTLQINGQAYLKDCYIEGDVDFMWGTGPCFFENCQCRAVTSRAYYTQIRNQPTNHGFVYLHCTFDGKEGITGAMLSRIGSAKYPASEMVLMDCVLGSAIAPAAWSIQGAVADVHFWEYNSHGVDVAKPYRYQPATSPRPDRSSRPMTQPSLPTTATPNMCWATTGIPVDSRPSSTTLQN